MNNSVLASTLNDPEGRLLKSISDYAALVRDIYRNNAGIVISAQTSDVIAKSLKDLNFKIVIASEDETMGGIYRESLKLGLTYDCQSIHMTDFDRILHWTKTFPDELTAFADKDISGLLLPTRTKRAFETHPYTQRSTEVIVNTIASKLIGRPSDIMSGCFAMDKITAEIILKESKRTDSGIYAEFINIVVKNKIKINSCTVEGLEWETPDRYSPEIKKEGHGAWLDKWQSITEWKRRISLVNNTLEAFTESIR